MKVLSILALVALGTCLQSVDLAAAKKKGKNKDITKENKRSSKNARKALRENNRQDEQIALATNGNIALQADVNDLKNLIDDPNSGLVALAQQVAELKTQIALMPTSDAIAELKAQVASMPSDDTVNKLQSEMQANTDAIAALKQQVQENTDAIAVMKSKAVASIVNDAIKDRTIVKKEESTSW